MIKKINLIFVAFISLLMTNLVASADTKLSIGSCPIGCTAYTWSAGIADVINNNVEVFFTKSSIPGTPISL